jgi:hypothetical protein
MGAPGPAVAVAADAHPDEGQLDVGERPPSTVRDEGIHLTQPVPRPLVPTIGTVGTTPRRVSPGLELSELFAAEVELLLQRRAQGRKPKRQLTLRSPRQLRVRGLGGGEM